KAQRIPARGGTSVNKLARSGWDATLQPIELSRICRGIALYESQGPAVGQRLDLHGLVDTALIGTHGLDNEPIHVQVATGNNKRFSNRIEYTNGLRERLIDAPKAHARQDVFAVIFQGVPGDRL